MNNKLSLIFLIFIIPFLSFVSSDEVPPHVSHTLLMVIPSNADPVNVAKLFSQLSTFQYTIPGIIIINKHLKAHLFQYFDCFFNIVIIEGILAYSAGPYSSHEDINRGYTHGFNIIFANTTFRDSYLVNPLHIAIGIIILLL